jgi:1-acyl-sn-glycerol-3-phosphate acyltransferase
VGLNSGVFWPRRQFLRPPGTIIVEICDPLPPGLDRAAFLQRMQAAIEDSSSRLVAEGEAEKARLMRA